jgi:transposase
MANNKKAKKMASKGASVKEIRKATGVSRGAAQKFTSRPSSGGGGRTSGASQATCKPLLHLTLTHGLLLL